MDEDWNVAVTPYIGVGVGKKRGRKENCYILPTMCIFTFHRNSLGSERGRSFAELLYLFQRFESVFNEVVIGCNRHNMLPLALSLVLLRQAHVQYKP